MEGKEYVLGVDVGGTKSAVGLVSRDGEIGRSRRYPMDRSDQEHTLRSIRDAIEDFMERERPQIKAIGLGLVGRVDTAGGIWSRAVNLSLFQPVPLGEELCARYGVPVSLDNDVFSAARAELLFGMGRQSKDFLVLNVGTGMSIGIVSGGRLVRGAGNVAGEAGHTVAGVCERTCKCGRAGCLECFCSGGGMIERARELLPDYPKSTLASLPAGELHSVSIFAHARRGDALAALIARDAVDGLCAGCCNLVSLLNPQWIVAAGGVFREESLIETIEDYVRKYAFSSSLMDFKGVRLSALDPAHAGLLGAGAVGWRPLE